MRTRQEHATEQSDPESFEGKTYTLRPAEATSDGYYETIGRLTDALLQSSSDEEALLLKVRALGKRKREILRLRTHDEDSPDARLIKILYDQLNRFTSHLQSHLHSLRGLDRWNRTLTMTEEQYHLAMVEIELVNRIYADRFRSCGTKYAFLPHCLRDLTADCRSAQRDIDYVCKGCSTDCNVNRASKTLRFHGVKPYIWMTADLRAIFRRVKKKGNSLGVLGIACVPELLRGMRMCLKHNIPVVGIPLDANRCTRWWGEFYPNTINLTILGTLLQR